MLNVRRLGWGTSDESKPKIRESKRRSSISLALFRAGNIFGDSSIMWNIARVIQETTLSRSTIYRLIKDGKFPAPTLISKRRVVWNELAIRTFLAGGV